jgi:hypothetical protein
MQFLKTVDWIRLSESAIMVYDAVCLGVGAGQSAVRETFFMDRPNFVTNRQEV